MWLNAEYFPFLPDSKYPYDILVLEVKGPRGASPPLLVWGPPGWELVPSGLGQGRHPGQWDQEGDDVLKRSLLVPAQCGLRCEEPKITATALWHIV